MVQISGCFELLTKEQQNRIMKMAEDMKDYWKEIVICWYSDGSKAYIVTDKNGTICPSEIIK